MSDPKTDSTAQLPLRRWYHRLHAWLSRILYVFTPLFGMPSLNGLRIMKRRLCSASASAVIAAAGSGVPHRVG